MSTQNSKKTDKNFYKDPDNISKTSVYTVNVDTNHSIPCFNNNEYGFVIPPKNLIIRFLTCKKCGSLPDVDFVRLFLLASYSNNYFLLENYQKKNILMDNTKNDILKKNKNDILKKDLLKNNQESDKNLLEYVETNVKSNKKDIVKNNVIENDIGEKINENVVEVNSEKTKENEIGEVNLEKIEDKKINENVVEINSEKTKENVVENSGNLKDEENNFNKVEFDKTIEIDKIEQEKKVIKSEDTKNVEKVNIKNEHEDTKNDEKDAIENSTQQKKVIRKSAYNSLLPEKTSDVKLKSRRSRRSIKKQIGNGNPDGLNNITENQKKIKRETDKSDLLILENNVEVKSLDTKNSLSNSEKVVKKYKPIHKCIDCNLKFVSKVKFNQHTKLNHPNDLSLIDKPFKCPIKNCDRPYKNRNGLEYHLVHSHFVSRKSLDKYMADYNLE